MRTQAKSKLVRIICICLALAIMLTCFLPVVSFAADKDERFIITGECIEQFDIVTNKEQIFDIRDASPGSKYYGEIVVKNNTSEKMMISITDISTNIEDRTLYEALNLKISHRGATLYSGKYGFTPEPVTNFIPIEGKQEIVFNVEVTFPEYSGNKFQGKDMDSTWYFESQYYDKEKIKTGVDLTAETQPNLLFPILTVLGVVLIIVSILLIFIFKNEEREEETKQNE